MFGAGEYPQLFAAEVSVSDLNIELSLTSNGEVILKPALDNTRVR